MTKLRSTRPYLVMGTQGYEGYLAEGYRGTVRVQKWQPLPVPTTHSGLPIPLPIPTSDQQKVAAVYSCLEVPCVGRFAQVCLNECMAANAWPTWVALQAKIKAFLLFGNNKEWARSQLLCLHQGPCQRTNDFLAQFQALKLQSECPDKYAKDLLERAVSRKILEQVYMQGHARGMWVQVMAAV